MDRTNSELTIWELVARPDEGPYLRPFLTDARDETFLEPVRARYAEWLRARRDPRGELLAIFDGLHALPEGDARRAALARIAELEEPLDPNWVRWVVHRGRIANCAAPEAVEGADPVVRFSYECPMRWERLLPDRGGNARVRHCERCNRNVHDCATYEEAERHALRGDCIHVRGNLLSEESKRDRPAMTGRPDALYFMARRIFER
jgi:hypothetical protein